MKSPAGIVQPAPVVGCGHRVLHGGDHEEPHGHSIVGEQARGVTSLTPDALGAGTGTGGGGLPCAVVPAYMETQRPTVHPDRSLR
jgi:hypothetical protein